MIVKFILVAMIGFLSVSTHAQNISAADESFDLESSSASLLEWFQFLEAQGFSLSYNATLLDLQEPVRLSQKHYTVGSFLEEVLYPYDFEAAFVANKKILLQIKGKKKMHLSGKVVDRETGERLYCFTVALIDSKGKKYLAVASEGGAFSTQVPLGVYTLTTSHLGFHSSSRTINLQRDQFLTIQLDPQSFPIAEVVVTPSPILDEINYSGPINLLSVNSSSFYSQLNSLPGISTSAVGGMYVNGGQSDENQILLDGIPVYHSHHNNSLLSQFNNDVIKNIAFYGSFIPGQYEGRLSSVTDVKLKDGNNQTHHQAFSMDMPAVSATFEGPIVKDKLSYLISGRHSWLDFFEKMFFDRSNTKRSFADIVAKISYKVTPTLFIQGLAYRSHDYYRDSTDYSRDQNVLKWKNNLYAVSLNSILAQKIINSNKIAYTEYFNKVFAPTVGINVPFYIQESMNRISMTSDYRSKLDNYVELSWGMKLTHERFNLLAQKDTIENNVQPITQVSMYASTKLSITERFIGNIALNFLTYIPKGSRSFFSIQPRFSFKYIVNDHDLMFFDFSRMEQFYHNICLSQIPLPSDFRMPSIHGFKPSSSVHLEFGWKHRLQNWSCNLSTYYKRRYNILGVRYDLLPEAEGWNKYIMKGNASSYGFKLHSLGIWDRWMLDFSYTFSKSKEWFEEYDQARKHPTLQDIPHMFNIGASFKIKEYLYASLGGYIKSGRLTNTYSEDPLSNVFKSRNEREKCNYRIDLNLSGTKKFENKGIELHYKVGLYNIVGNPLIEEIIDLYSLETNRHCLPYFSLNLKL